MFIIFDLDGTLANGEQRQHFLDKEPKDWDGWHAACGKDDPHAPLLHIMVDFMALGHDVEIWTGRSETTREMTEGGWRKPDIVFEDRKRMVEAWRSRGIMCVQVAPGDF